ncbi:MAG: hypothetical protein LV481_12645 [Methylacidiphilales bacterium]|nr:hypothetical protein [Candidatus Methylacidiphilales bacterium]
MIDFERLIIGPLLDWPIVEFKPTFPRLHNDTKDGDYLTGVGQNTAGKVKRVSVTVGKIHLHIGGIWQVIESQPAYALAEEEQNLRNGKILEIAIKHLSARRFHRPTSKFGSKLLRLGVEFSVDKARAARRLSGKQAPDHLPPPSVLPVDRVFVQSRRRDSRQRCRAKSTL